MKALLHEPDKRYTSVGAFASDVRAFLESRPVAARSGNGWYRMRKFVRRYWVPVSAAALVIASMTTGLYIANRERPFTQLHFQEVRKLSHTFVFDLHDEVAKLEGSTKAREMMVRTGLEYLDNLARNAGRDLQLQSEIAGAYMKNRRCRRLSHRAQPGPAPGRARQLSKAGVSTGQSPQATPRTCLI